MKNHCQTGGSIQNKVLTIIFVTICLLSALPSSAETRKNGQEEGAWVFANVIPGKHRGAVTALIHKGEEILSAGEDGFIEIWNVRSAAAVERFQLSPYNIIAMAARPGKDEICLVENDGLGLYRIAVWNYRERNNLFTLRFRDPIGFISYSTGGNFIIAARTGRTGVVFIDAENGSVLRSPQSLTGMAGFAATGRSERNMMVYLLSGVLSYWDLESGNETNHFEVPSNLSSPIVFGNNRYLAGVDSNGLAVLDAVSGNLLARNDTIPAEALLCAAGDEFFCLVSGGDYAGIYRFAVDRGGRLTGRGRFPLPANSEDGMSSGDAGASVIAANAVPGGGIVLGTKSGEVILINQYGQAQTMSVSVQTRIFETAASGKTIAFLAENNTIGFLPLDYTSLSAGGIIKTEKDSRYTRISPYAEETGEAGRFIFWQAENASLQSVIKSAEGEPLLLGGISFRFPVRSVSSAGGKILFLDSAGNLSAILPQGGASANRPFSFFSVGLMDAAFIDKDNIIAARSAVSGNSPFLMININTGETVPLPYPSDAGVMVYRGASGSIYTAAVEQDSAGIKTSILRLNTASPAQSLRLVDLQEEDIQFSLAESQGRLAATIGGEGAAIYSAGAIQKFERSPGLPVRLISGGPYFISLDSEGSICWHESRAGKLLAIFRLYKRHWELHTTHGSINGSW